MAFPVFNCYIFSGEENSVTIITDYINKSATLSLIQVHNNPRELEYNLKRSLADIIFIDIDTENHDGLAIARALRLQTKFLIIITAFDHNAYNAFRLRANDYLLKPLSFTMLEQALDNILSSKLDLEIKKENHGYIFVHHADVRGKISRLAYKDIIAFESSNNNVKIYCKNEEIWVYQTLAQFVNLTKGKGFSQPHRSFLVSIDEVKSLMFNTLILSNGLIIPIGRNFKASFTKALFNNRNS